MDKQKLTQYAGEGQTMRLVSENETVAYWLSGQGQDLAGIIHQFSVEQVAIFVLWPLGLKVQDGAIVIAE